MLLNAAGNERQIAAVAGLALATRHVGERHRVSTAFDGFSDPCSVIRTMARSHA